MRFYKAEFDRHLTEIIGAKNIKPNSLVYVLQCADGIVKVGTSWNLMSRLALMRDYPHLVQSILWMRRYTRPDAEGIERAVKILLKDRRHFYLSMRLTDYYRCPSEEVIAAVERAELACDAKAIAAYAFDPIPIWLPPESTVRRKARIAARGHHTASTVTVSPGSLAYRRLM